MGGQAGGTVWMGGQADGTVWMGGQAYGTVWMGGQAYGTVWMGGQADGTVWMGGQADGTVWMGGQADGTVWMGGQAYGTVWMGGQTDGTVWMGVKQMEQYEWGVKQMERYEWGVKHVEQYEWGVKQMEQYEWGVKQMEQYEWGVKQMEQYEWGVKQMEQYEAEWNQWLPQTTPTTSCNNGSILEYKSWTGIRLWPYTDQHKDHATPEGARHHHEKKFEVQISTSITLNARGRRRHGLSLSWNQLQVDGKCPVPDAIIVDGCAVLWVIQWPPMGHVFEPTCLYVRELLKRRSDRHQIFHRYHHDNIK